MVVVPLVFFASARILSRVFATGVSVARASTFWAGNAAPFAHASDGEALRVVLEVLQVEGLVLGCGTDDVVAAEPGFEVVNFPLAVLQHRELERVHVGAEQSLEKFESVARPISHGPMMYMAALPWPKRLREAP